MHKDNSRHIHIPVTQYAMSVPMGGVGVGGGGGLYLYIKLPRDISFIFFNFDRLLMISYIDVVYLCCTLF